MLKLKATKRSTLRYILFSGSDREGVSALLQRMLGVMGVSRLAARYVAHGTEVIVAVDRAAVDSVRAAVELDPGETRIVRVSGTLKGLRRNL
ncbi:MAG TPA: hypothetical protein VJK51_03180 [Candidatus Nanoarchaeia archaeon]|nr:hypothetical protein [Candidatus Nanoarchaeia archaeon]